MKCPHCDTSIHDHAASRCLDTWVASVVFDDFHWEMNGEGKLVSIAPDYSTDISAAWEVLEKLPHGITVTRNARTGIESLTIWQRKTPGTGRIRAAIDAANLPLAICQAVIDISHD